MLTEEKSRKVRENINQRATDGPATKEEVTSDKGVASRLYGARLSCWTSPKQNFMEPAQPANRCYSSSAFELLDSYTRTSVLSQAFTST